MTPQPPQFHADRVARLSAPPTPGVPVSIGDYERAAREAKRLRRSPHVDAWDQVSPEQTDDGGPKTSRKNLLHWWTTSLTPPIGAAPGSNVSAAHIRGRVSMLRPMRGPGPPAGGMTYPPTLIFLVNAGPSETAHQRWSIPVSARCPTWRAAWDLRRKLRLGKKVEVWGGLEVRPDRRASAFAQRFVGEVTVWASRIAIAGGTDEWLANPRRQIPQIPPEPMDRIDLPF